MVKINDTDIPYLEFAEAAAPGTPASAITRIYTKADGLMYSKDDAGAETLMSGGAGGAPSTADYLVGTANGSLSAEIVVGTTPGGELGNTWASPTVDATHSGSSHAALPFKGCRVEHSTVQSINNNAFTALTFDTESAPYYDTSAIHATTNFTAVTAGYWSCGAAVCQDTAATGINILAIYVNGTEITGTRNRQSLSATNTIFLDVIQPLLLALNDVVTFQYYQNSGSALNVGSASAGVRSTAFMYFLGV